MYVRSQFIPQEALFSGNWLPYLDELLAQDRPEPPDVGGAEIAAEEILGRMDGNPEVRGGPPAED